MRDGNRASDDEEIVYVPVPKRFLPVAYQALAEAAANAKTADKSLPPMQEVAPEAGGATQHLMIDLIIKAAYAIGANRHPVSLPELHTAYLRSYPGIGKGTGHGSFDATVNYYCINMRSRFPDASNKRKPAYWLSRPVFKRVARARYMLLSEEEIAQFRRCVEEDHPLVYENEYNVADLVRCAGKPDTSRNSM